MADNTTILFIPEVRGQKSPKQPQASMNIPAGLKGKVIARKTNIRKMTIGRGAK